MNKLRNILLLSGLVTLSVTKHLHKHFHTPSTAAQEPFPIVPRRMNLTFAENLHYPPYKDWTRKVNLKLDLVG